MRGYVKGVGLCGPGLSNWHEGLRILSQESGYVPKPVGPLRAEWLPATERRRAGNTVKLAVQVAQEAVGQAGKAPGTLPTVFASSGGDLETVHELCLALSKADKFISPTRFHNSVHNAAAGYWSIATGAMSASTSISAYDWTFAAGLLEAFCQMHCTGDDTLLVVYDWPAPEPLNAKRPIASPFGIALVLSASEENGAYGMLDLSISNLIEESGCSDAALESLRRSVPAARALPLLDIMARRESGSVLFDYLGQKSLRADLTPCR